MRCRGAAATASGTVESPAFMSSTSSIVGLVLARRRVAPGLGRQASSRSLRDCTIGRVYAPVPRWSIPISVGECGIGIALSYGSDRARARHEGLLRRRRRGRRRLAASRGWRVHGARRPVGMREVDVASRHRRSGRDHRAGDLDRGSDVTDLAPRHRDIAMVFQSYALYPHMSVRQNLGYGLKVRRTSKAEIRRRVDEVATMLGLDDLLERKPAQLSGGQRQRVAMGRAIVPRAAGVPHGRAALEPRREAPRRHAGSLAQLHRSS